MRDDDDVLKDYDLDAWEAPEPPEDLAEGVLARLGGTEVGAAVPVEPSAPRRRALLIGGVAAAVIAATLGTYAVIGSTRHQPATNGSVLADRAQPLTIEGVNADLDPGADVQWAKSGKTIRVEQRAGTAAWRVDGKTSLVIDAGAAVASVEATGASLRVEVQTNSIGASTAAAAMVTVVVYEGHVKVSGAGHQTVIVEPGSTWTSTPPTPVVAGTPGEDEIEVTPDPQPDDEKQVPPVAAGSGGEVTVDDGCDEVSCVLDNYAGACCQKYRPERMDRVPRVRDKANGCDEVSCVLSNYEGPCCAALRDDARRNPQQNRPAPATGLDRQMITDGIAKVKPQVLACGEKYPAKGVVKAAVKVHPDGRVTNVEIKATPTAELGGCVARVIQSARFAETDTGGSFTYPFVFDVATQSTPACDAVKLSDEGMEKLNEGQHAAALVKFEASLACQSDPKTIKLAYLSACNSLNRAKAKLYYTKLTPAERDRFRQICIRNNIDLEGDGGDPADPFASPRPASCDADALMAKGRELAKQDEHADALEKFEEALQCKPSAELLQLAFTAACNSSDYKKAKLYYPKLAKDAQQKLALACARNNVPYDADSTCDAKAVKDKGLEYVTHGQHAAALAQFEAAMRCKPSDELVQLAFMAACNSMNSAKAKVYYPKLPAAKREQFSMMCIRNKVEFEDATKACDADELKEKGMEAVNKGQHSVALGMFEAALRCKSSEELLQLAFMSSCNSLNSPKAKFYFAKLPRDVQERAQIMCIRNKVEYQDVGPTCDADALKDQGMEAVNKGQHAAALAKFEASLACKKDAYVTQLAFMESCNSRNSAKAKSYYGKLTAAQQKQFGVICERSKVDYLPSSTTCDADDLKESGIEAVNMGQHAGALAKFEASLRCKPDAYVTQLAFMAACNSMNSAKARVYYKQLTPQQQDRYRVMCERNKVDYGGASCDADAFKEQGMEYVNSAQHAAALVKFEASLRCKQDGYVTQLAFMASCNSLNSAKAKLYYKQLTPAQQNKLSVMCERNHVEFESGPTPTAGKGILEVMCTSEAKILVDGVDTGLSTPIRGDKLQLNPGKHKVTFVIDGNRFTYAVDIVAGETSKLSKDLR